MLTNQDEHKVKKIILEAIQEVVIPAMEDLADKEDIKKLDNRMSAVENRMDALENRVGQMDRKLDIMTGKVFEHDTKIKKMEHQTISS